MSIKLYLRIISIIVATIAPLAVAQQLANLPTEQISLHLDKQHFEGGDTITVQGVVTSIANSRIRPYSRYVFVELINNDSVFVRQKLRCDSIGRFATRLPTDPLFDNGVYYLRAYTMLMCNFKSEAFGVVPMFCGIKRDSNLQEPEVKCIAWTSDGFILADTMQHVAVSVTNKFLQPIAGATVAIYDSTGTCIASATTSPSGMANIGFIPTAGSQYHIVYANRQFPVPEVKTNATKVEASLLGDKMHYKIANSGNLTPSHRIYTYDRINGLLRINQVTHSGIIQLKDAPTVATIFVADTLGNIVSQYTTMQRGFNVESTLAEEITVRKNDNIVPAAGIDVNSIVSWHLFDEQNSLDYSTASSLLFLSEYSSALPFPSKLWCSKPRVRTADLCSWLSTATLSRFDLCKVICDTEHIYTHHPEVAIAIKGKVTDKNKKPVKGGSIVAYQTTSNAVYEGGVNEHGQFNIAVDDFTDGTEFFLQTINSKGKPEKLDLSLPGDTFPSPKITYKPLENIDKILGVSVDVGAANWDKMQLPEVIVKARMRNNDKKSTEKFYSNTYFDQETINNRKYISLIDILKDIPAIIVTRTSVPADENENGGLHQLGWTLSSRRGASSMNGGDKSKGTLPIIVDGTKYDVDMFNTAFEMPASEIETVEYMRPWQAIAYTSGALDGAIFVTTRRYSKSSERQSKGIFYSPFGLTCGFEPNNPTHYPSTAGKYVLVYDVFSANGPKSVYQIVNVTE